MKIIIILIVLSGITISYSQKEFLEDELIINLINYNNNSVTATANIVINQGSKWYPFNHQYAYSIIEDNSFNTVTSNNDFTPPNYYGAQIIFDLEHDQNPYKTLAISFYKISFSGKQSKFYVNTVSEDFADVHVTFDYANDKLYFGQYAPYLNEIEKTDIVYTYNLQNTVPLEEYWPHGLYGAVEQYFPGKVLWSKYPTNNTIEKYRLYKAITTSQTAPNENEFQWITDLPNNIFNYEDMHIQDSFGDQYAYFFVKAYFYNGSSYVWSDKTNIVRSQIFQDWESTLHIGRSGDHPRIVWWPYPESSNTILSYKIYRAVTSPSVPPQTPVFSLLTTVDNDVFSFDDQEFVQGTNILHYYIKAVLSPPEDGSPFDSEASNIVVTTGGLYKQMEETTTQHVLKNFLFFDNYPNPFNPVTTIGYKIPQRSNVSIKVYDILGREIQELVNEVKESGEHNIQFNAESLSSGVYIYTITASNGNSILFKQSKQMILMK